MPDVVLIAQSDERRAACEYRLLEVGCNAKGCGVLENLQFNCHIGTGQGVPLNRGTNTRDGVIRGGVVRNDDF